MWWTLIATKHLLKLERKSSIGQFKVPPLWLIEQPNRVSIPESSHKRPPHGTFKAKRKLQCLWAQNPNSRTRMVNISRTRHRCYHSWASKWASWRGRKRCRTRRESWVRRSRGGRSGQVVMRYTRTHSCTWRCSRGSGSLSSTTHRKSLTWRSSRTSNAGTRDRRGRDWWASSGKRAWV